MSSNPQIAFQSRLDRPTITAALTAGPFMVDVVNNHVDAVPVSVDITGMDATYLEAFLKTIDYFTMISEADALIWVIERSGKVFDLTGSYIRNKIGTDGTPDALVAGSALKVRFDVPGFQTNTFREIDLWKGQAFNPDDVALVAEIGITLTGDGDEFTIDNITDCKVSFSKPGTVTDVYVIQYSNTIITP